MVYNRYYLNTLIRILFLTLSNLAFFYFLFGEGRFFTTVFFGILILLQVVWLFYYINLVNFNLSRFLLMLGEEETAIIPLKNRIEKTFGGLQHSFERLNREMLKMRLETEYASILVQHVVDHLASGILAWDGAGRVKLINTAGLKLLNLKELNSIEELETRYPGMQNWLEALSSAGKGTWDLVPSLSSGPAGIKIPLAFRSSVFQLGDEHLTLASFQNIKAEMEETEMESWEKLIRVLTHEVSNSVTPITTLGSNIRKRIQSVKKQDSGGILLTGALASDIERSAELIEQRGNGLIDFIGQYKSFMRLPEPDIRELHLKDLLEDACKLGQSLISDLPYEINCNLKVRGIKCLADRKMMEQVLLNLVRNALESIPSGKQGRITISGNLGEPGYAAIHIQDNGSGIPEEIRDQVFIPFFTTKAKGSGIGLSFCRRIVHLNRGSILVESTSEKGTIILILLPLA